MNQLELLKGLLYLLFSNEIERITQKKVRELFQNPIRSLKNFPHTMNMRAESHIPSNIYTFPKGTHFPTQTINLIYIH